MRRWIEFGLALVCACGNGCTSMVPINPGDSQEVAARVRPGDNVALVTRAGARAEMVVSAVDDGSITGDGVRYPLEELQSLQVQKSDPGKAGVGALLVLSIVGLVLLLVAIASSIPPGMPG